MTIRSTLSAISNQEANGFVDQRRIRDFVTMKTSLIAYDDNSPN